MRYWQRGDTGYICAVENRPSPRWYEISKDVYDSAEAAQQWLAGDGATPVQSEEAGVGYHSLVAELLAISNILGVPDLGDVFEAQLIHTHLQYLLACRAMVQKVGVTKGFDKRKQRPFAKGPTLCDFVGVIAGPGRSVAFDAKRRQIKKDSDWRWQYSAAPAHQWLGLQAYEAMGGCGFFLIAIEEGYFVAKEARLVMASLGRPGKSLDLRGCPVVEYDGIWDWLSVLEQLDWHRGTDLTGLLRVIEITQCEKPERIDATST